MQTEPIGMALTESFAEVVAEGARARGIDVRPVRLNRLGSLLDDPRSVEVVLGAGGLRDQGLSALLRRAPAVRWVHATSAGVEGFLVPELLERDIVLSRTRGLHDVPVSEFAMGLILLAAKKFRDLLQAQERGEWLDMQLPQLRNATLAIVGYGEIGRALAKRARAFDMRVLGVRRRPGPDDLTEELVGVDRLHQALARADFVVILAPSTRESRHLIGEAELKVMKPEAFLINVARGDLVDERALEVALRTDQLAGALLDTVSEEPLPPEHPFWTNPKIVITPHVAGLRKPGISRPALEQFLDNLGRYVRKEPLLNLVDRQAGY